MTLDQRPIFNSQKTLSTLREFSDFSPIYYPVESQEQPSFDRREKQIKTSNNQEIKSKKSVSKEDMKLSNSWKDIESLVNLKSVALDSTIHSLKLYNYQVEVSELVREIKKKFEKNPTLPGVILRENNILFGLISQKQFWQYMSRPYSLELSAKRSIKYLDDLLNIKPLVLPKDMSIIKAVKESLARPPQLLEEPIIVEIGPQKYRLLDVHQLLVAQTRIHELASELLVKMYKKVERSSQVDGLTNLANRRLFDKSLLSKCNRAVKQKNSLSLIMCDVDFFQQYNELYGHLAGDDCLQKIANVIKKSLTRPKKDLAARYQGGEFAILLPNTDAVAAMSVASEIAKRVKNLAIRNHASPISSYVTLSFGIANIIPTREKDSELLLVGADRALSQAKRAGRNRQVVWKNSELKTAIKGLKVSKVENQSDKKVCIVLRDEDFSIASNYLRELGINTQLQLKNISIVSVSNIPENLSDFDVLVLDVASDRSPCISLIERIKFDGDLVIFAIESLPEAIRSNLSEKSTDFLIKPIPWKELKDKPYFS